MYYHLDTLMSHSLARRQPVWPWVQAWATQRAQLWQTGSRGRLVAGDPGYPSVSLGEGKQFPPSPTKLAGNLDLLATGMPLLMRTAYHQAIMNRIAMHSSSSTLYATHFTKPNPCILQGPLFVYLIGTGFTETVRPVVLQPKHISTFQSHALTGISKLPPEV